MRLNAPTVKVKGIRGRYVRECDYRAAMRLADEVESMLAGRSSGYKLSALLAELKKGEVRDYPSVIATKAKRGEKHATTSTQLGQ